LLASAKRYPWFSFFCFASIVLFLTLGSWQVIRLEWKEGLIKEISENLKKSPIFITSSNYKSPDLLYKKVKANGRFLSDSAIRLNAKYRDNELGYHIITPFVTSDGATLFINRGWASKEKPPETTLSKKTYIEGIVAKEDRKAAWFLPQNQPEKNIWFWKDLKQFSKYLKERDNIDIEPVLVQQTHPKSETPPLTLKVDVNLRNDHAGYAFTWYSLALVVLVMYLFFIRSKSEKK